MARVVTENGLHGLIDEGGMSLGLEPQGDLAQQLEALFVQEPFGPYSGPAVGIVVDDRLERFRT